MTVRERLHAYLAGLACGLFAAALLAYLGHATWNACMAGGWLTYAVALAVKP